MEEARLASRISFTAPIVDCNSLSTSIYPGDCISGFFAFVVTIKNLRSAAKARRTEADYPTTVRQLFA